MGDIRKDLQPETLSFFVTILSVLSILFYPALVQACSCANCDSSYWSASSMFEQADVVAVVFVKSIVAEPVDQDLIARLRDRCGARSYFRVKVELEEVLKGEFKGEVIIWDFCTLPVGIERYLLFLGRQKVPDLGQPFTELGSSQGLVSSGCRVIPFPKAEVFLKELRKKHDE